MRAHCTSFLYTCMEVAAGGASNQTALKAKDNRGDGVPQSGSRLPITNCHVIRQLFRDVAIANASTQAAFERPLHLC